jgi:hypothetical protein
MNTVSSFPFCIVGKLHEVMIRFSQDICMPAYLICIGWYILAEKCVTGSRNRDWKRDVVAWVRIENTDTKWL